MVRGRPTPLGGAVVDPKHRRFARIARIVRVLQPAMAARLASLSDLHWIMSRIGLRWETARLGAMVEIVFRRTVVAYCTVP